MVVLEYKVLRLSQKTVGYVNIFEKVTYHFKAVSSPADAAISRWIISWLATSYLFFVGSTNAVGLADNSPVTCKYQKHMKTL